MHDISRMDYTRFDHPEITGALFYPRPEWGDITPGSSAEEMLIPVEDDIVIGARLHMSGKGATNLLFFHGNGEIVADYNDLGPVYTGMGINFLPVDYRGYGKSTGTPTASAMMRDAHGIFHYVNRWLDERGHTGSLIVMGRSLGSAPALELATHYRDQMDGLVIESGFAHAGPLLRLMGISMDDKGWLIKFPDFVDIAKALLFIHAEYDHIISFSEGLLLFDACPAGDKRLLKINGANHNDIFFRGMSQYLESIQWIVGKAAAAIKR